ncbi:hypothetical protein [Caminibacter mediatlanticus]|uniref:Uncharacterized protein n=1 Tax=Caminibacter mediatlanticus TB-2 TaxID=391592 RepID=A0AAI9AFT6_9BACT|nr:hypothetical protein [Caminibacter mediatlanticus]EDM22831.1 hypothetical protein CMTB2_04132 [Caminibacter mediatlanticus TB-2]
MKKILIILSISGKLLLAKTCIVTFIIKKAEPSYPHIFYQEEFICKNAREGWKFQKGLGCRHRSFRDKNWIQYNLYICPIYVTEKRN